MTVQFAVSGEPVGKGRPRFARNGNYVRAYTPEKTRAYEQLVAWAYKQEGRSFGAVPVQLVVRAYFGVPASAPKKKRAAMLAGEIPCTKKPDADNIVKCIADALNGTAYDDDRQIVQIVCSKRWTDSPRVEVEISDEIWPLEHVAAVLRRDRDELERMSKIAKEDAI